MVAELAPLVEAAAAEREARRQVDPTRISAEEARRRIQDGAAIPEDDGALDAIEDLPGDAMYAAGLMEKSF